MTCCAVGAAGRATQAAGPLASLAAVCRRACKHSLPRSLYVALFRLTQVEALLDRHQGEPPVMQVGARTWLLRIRICMTVVVAPCRCVWLCAAGTFSHVPPLIPVCGTACH